MGDSKSKTPKYDYEENEKNDLDLSNFMIGWGGQCNNFYGHIVIIQNTHHTPKLLTHRLCPAVILSKKIKSVKQFYIFVSNVTIFKTKYIHVLEKVTISTM